MLQGDEIRLGILLASDEVFDLNYKRKCNYNSYNRNEAVCVLFKQRLISS
jgi:hypothetical protein